MLGLNSFVDDSEEALAKIKSRVANEIKKKQRVQGLTTAQNEQLLAGQPNSTVIPSVKESILQRQAPNTPKRTHNHVITPRSSSKLPLKKRKREGDETTKKTLANKRMIKDY